MFVLANTEAVVKLILEKGKDFALSKATDLNPLVNQKMVTQLRKSIPAII